MANFADWFTWADDLHPYNFNFEIKSTQASQRSVEFYIKCNL